MEAALRVERLSFGYPGLPLFRGLDLVLPAGEVRVLLGPSGSGKTTLVHLLAGLLRPMEGEIYWGETGIAQLPEARLVRLRRRWLGLVFQHHYLLPELSVLENVALPGLITGRPDWRRAEALLAAVDLADRARLFPEALSGGERQRVAVARALYARPRLLLADEPTGALDATNADRVFTSLLNLAREEGAAVLIATHDQRLVAGLLGWRLVGGRLLSLDS